MITHAAAATGMPSCKVLLVGPLPPPSGGMANQTRQLARLLRESGIAVELVQTNAGYRPAWIGQVRGLRAAFRLGPYLRRLWRGALSADLMHVMANSGWAWHLFAAPAVWIGQLRRIPVVVNYRGGGAEAFFHRHAAWVKPTLRRAAAVIVPSAFLENVFKRIGVAAEIVPNIVDTGRFHPAPSRVAGRHVVVTRNLEDIYDIPTALHAFAAVRKVHADATLTVAGAGSTRGELEALARTLGIDGSVHFTGRLDNEKVADLYRDADLVLNPSTVDNMPISLLEAMASGVPIVSTNVGGVPHLVEHDRSALLVPARDPAAMAGAALRVFNDGALASRLREAGLEAVRAYAWPKVRGELFGVYARVLGRNSLETCEA